MEGSRLTGSVATLQTFPKWGLLHSKDWTQVCTLGPLQTPPHPPHTHQLSSHLLCGQAQIQERDHRPSMSSAGQLTLNCTTFYWKEPEKVEHIPTLRAILLA